MSKIGDEARRAFEEYMKAAPPLVSEEMAARLLECATEHDLDIEALLDWASQTLIAQGLLENVLDGQLDVVGRTADGDWQFRMTSEGAAKVEDMLSQDQAGKSFLKKINELKEFETKVLDADVLIDE